MPAGRSSHKDFVKANFRTIWPVHLTAFFRLLRHLRAEFDGDLDLLLILAAVSERTPARNWQASVENYRDILHSSDTDRRQSPINLQSVADYTGIPRETVRRKIAVLERKGWVSRDGAGNIGVQPKAATDLERATGHSVDYLSEILAAHDAAAGRTG